MKKYIIILINLISLNSCHEYYYDSDYPCGFCYTEDYQLGVLTIQTTLNDENPNIPIVIYIDEIENDLIEHIDTINEANFEIWVPVDNYYTVTAEYKVGNKTITAVDKARVYKKENTSDCDEDCWIVFDGTVDVRLKYDD